MATSKNSEEDKLRDQVNETIEKGFKDTNADGVGMVVIKDGAIVVNWKVSEKCTLFDCTVGTAQLLAYIMEYTELENPLLEKGSGLDNDFISLFEECFKIARGMIKDHRLFLGDKM